MPLWSLIRDRHSSSYYDKLVLHSRKKWTINGTSRINPVRETLEKVIPIAKKIGVTRVVDTTYMDRLCVPNYSAVLPGTEDAMRVYYGKGLTNEHAKASAIMESIERYCSLPSTDTSRQIIVGSFEELSKKYKSVLHPDELVEPLQIQYKNDMIMEFIVGTELFTNTRILVPAGLALYQYKHPITKSSSHYKVVNPFAHTHTNGLASGNVIEEAVCHALCELIERDASSIAKLCSTVIPYTMLVTIATTLNENGYPVKVDSSDIANKFVDDVRIFPDVDISDVEIAPIKNLRGRFEQANLPLIIKDITSNIGIPSFMAASFEPVSSDYGFFNSGHGTHPDTRIALIRAITELAQHRVVNIEGARDHFVKYKFKLEGEDATTKRRWQFKESKNKIQFSKIKTHVNENILDDIKLILEHLRQAGLKKAIIVDLTNKNIGIPVVRAIVPGLEIFTVAGSVMSKRAKGFFKKNI
jgi:thioglycine synthase